MSTEQVSSLAIEDWFPIRRVLGRDEFRARFAHPFLLRKREQRKSDSGQDWTERVAFDTGIVVPAAPTVVPGLEGAQLYPVVKAPRNPFPERISVGRALNCDVVVREPSVSKLHAHFQQVFPNQAHLMDVKSANGTRVNGKRISVGDAMRVGNGDLLQFGGVVLQFVSPEALYDLLGAGAPII